MVICARTHADALCIDGSKDVWTTVSLPRRRLNGALSQLGTAVEFRSIFDEVSSDDPGYPDLSPIPDRTA